MLKVICHVLCSLCGRLSGLGGAGCSEPNHQVITVLCGPHRQQIRLGGSMICSWKSMPLKSKSILSERLPKDKVPCVTESARLCLCVCVCWPGLCFVCIMRQCMCLCFYLVINHLLITQSGEYNISPCMHRLITNSEIKALRFLRWLHGRMPSVIATHWRQLLVSMTLDENPSGFREQSFPYS